MKRRVRFATLVAAALVIVIDTVYAASFSYHGTLQDSGNPAEGSYDIELTLYSAPTGGNVIGGPLVMYKVPVHGGSFNTEADFGPLTQSFTQAYVGVKVRNAGGGEFAALNTRAPMSVAATASVCPGAWTLAGNAGNPAGSYLGTADNRPLILEANGQALATFIGTTTAVPANSVALGNATSATGYADFAAGDGTSATGPAATALGAGSQASGHTSFAAGQNAIATHAGSFVWADDSSNSSFGTTGNQQFLIRAAGGVGINTPAPLSPLHVQSHGSVGTFAPPTGTVATFENGEGSTRILLMGTNMYGTSVTFGTPANADDGEILFNYSSNPGGFVFSTHDNFGALFLDSAGDLEISGTSASKAGTSQWTTTSDRRIKQEIAPIHDALDTVMKLRPVNFRYTPAYRAMEGGMADKPYQGFVAQEFAQVFPDAVTSTRKHVPGAADGDAPILALDPNPALITTVAAVQELAVHDQTSSEEIAALKQENADLRGQLDDVHGELNEVLVRLSKLENKQEE